MQFNLNMDVKDLFKPSSGGAGRGKNAYPSKATLNLGTKPKSINSPSRAIPLFLFLLLLIAIFAKFGVSDLLVRTADAEEAAAQAEMELETIRAQTVDFDAVYEEYERRVVPAQTLNDALNTDAMDVLHLIESRLMNAALLKAFAVQEPIVNVQLSGVSLSDAARLVRSLESSPLVHSVMVYTADSTETPTPAPTETPKPTKTPRRKKKSTPTPEPTATPAPTSTPEAVVEISMAITLAAGGES